MGVETGISWTDATFNPWIGCTKVSDECKYCYAEDLAKNRMRLDVWGPTRPRHRTSTAYWRQPLVWNRRARRTGQPFRVFCASLADVFEDHPTAHELRPALFDLIGACEQLTWQVLTKRSERLATELPEGWMQHPWPHVWLGVSAGTRRDGLPRIAHLQAIPAAVRFVSMEPLLEDMGALDLRDIHQVIIGGESGPHHRPMELAWLESIVEQCRSQGVAVWVKQDSARRPGTRGHIPDRLWVQEWPEEDRG